MAIRGPARRPILAAAIAALAASCGSPAVEPLKLDGNRLTVDNQSAQEWLDVEIWLNTHYRATTRSVPAGGRFQAPLDSFVAGFGQRFDFGRAQIKDLRLTAHLPDGTPIEVRKTFDTPGVRRLAGALKGKQ